MRAIVFVLAVLAAHFACEGCASPPPASDAAPDATPDAPPSVTWDCPPEWVPLAGGCAPAVLACAATDGGAAPDACAALDWHTPRAVPDDPDADPGTDPDASAAASPGTTFYVAPDGAIRGGWREPGEDGGPPAPDWVPRAGITHCAPGWTLTADGYCDPHLRADCPEGSAPIPGGRCTPTGADACPPTGAYADVSAEMLAGTHALHVRADADPAGADGSLDHPFTALDDALAAASAGDWVLLAEGTYAPPAGVINRSVHVVGVCAARARIAATAPGAAIMVTTPRGALDLRDVTITNATIGSFTGAYLGLTRTRVEHVTGCAVQANGAGSVLAFFQSVLTDVQPPAVISASSHPCAVTASYGGTARVSQSAVIGYLAYAGVHAVVNGSADVQDSLVRDGRIRTGGPYGNGLKAEYGGTLTAARVAVIATSTVGIGASDANASITVSDSLVQDTRPLGDSLGYGVEAQNTGRITLVNTSMVANTAAGAVSADGGVLTVTDSIAFGTLPHVRDGYGFGVGSDAAQTTATRVVIARSAGRGVFAAAGRVTLRDSIVRDTLLDVSRTEGPGIEVQRGGTLVATGVLVDNSYQNALLVQDPGSRASFTDGILRGTRPIADGRFGRGAVVLDGHGELTRTLVENNREIGVLVGAGADLLVRQCVVRGTQTNPRTRSGNAVGAQQGSLVVEQSLLEDNVGIGAQVVDHGSLVMRDSLVRHTTPTLEAGEFGNGVVCALASTLALTRVLVDDHQRLGIFTLDDCQTTLRDVIVTNVRGDTIGAGYGVAVFDASTLDAARVAVSSVSGVGFAAATYLGDPGASASARVADLYVTGVVPGPLSLIDPASGAPMARDVAYGLLVGAGCSLDATRALVSGAQYGLYDARGTLALHDAWVVDNSVAAGATSGLSGQGALVLDRAALVGNARNEVLSDVDLPSETALEVPPPLCPDTGCQ